MDAPADGVGMSCRELIELVTDYLEAALPEPERARFEAHLAECPGCTAWVAQMRVTIRVAGRLDEEALPAETRARLLEAFKAWKKTQ